MLIVLGCVVVGGIAGELIGVERGLTAFGEGLKRRFGRGLSRFAEGFVVASLVFCVGPLTILGSIQDGLSGDYSLLAVKSMLDVRRPGVRLRTGLGSRFLRHRHPGLPGSLNPLRRRSLRPLHRHHHRRHHRYRRHPHLGIGLRLLELRKVRVANLLPSLLLAPVVVAALQAFR